MPFWKLDSAENSRSFEKYLTLPDKHKTDLASFEINIGPRYVIQTDLERTKPRTSIPNRHLHLHDKNSTG